MRGTHQSTLSFPSTVPTIIHTLRPPLTTTIDEQHRIRFSNSFDVNGVDGGVGGVCDGMEGYDADEIEESEEPKLKEYDETQTRRPPNHPFWQQNLPTLKPVFYDTRCISIIFFVVAMLFFPIGASIFIASKGVVEYEIRYDDKACDITLQEAVDRLNSSSIYYHQMEGGKFLIRGTENDAKGTLYNSMGAISDSCRSRNYRSYGNINSTTVIAIKILKRMDPPIFFYYKLSDYYSNSRQYIKSFSQTQLQGESSTARCESGGDEILINNKSLPLYPCGYIAQSYFNDTFNATLCRTTTNSPLSPFSSDPLFDRAFRVPQPIPSPDYPSLALSPNYSSDYNDTNGRPIMLSYPSSSHSVPSSIECRQLGTSFDYGNPLWEKSKRLVWKNDHKKFFQASGVKEEQRIGKGGFELPRVDDEDFIVWMRYSALPSFRKLYRIINVPLLPDDTLYITSNNVYPYFGGKKYMIISTVSVFGGKSSDIMAIIYMLVASLALIVSGVFWARHKILPRMTGDMNYFFDRY